MTEAEWNVFTDPIPMLSVVRGVATGRKATLFAAACCRQDDWLMRDIRSRQAVEWAERVVDRLVRPDDLNAPSDSDCYLMAAAANRCLASGEGASNGEPEEAFRWASEAAEMLREDADSSEHSQSQADFLRCIFGPQPFRLITLDRIWLTSTVSALAESIYEGRDFGHLPILADALGDAGCSHADILNHCRHDGHHALGCWVVDLLLGKS